MKDNINFIILGLIMVLSSSCLSDLRTKQFRDESNYSEENRQKGMEILDRFAATCGATEWKNIQVYEVDFTDDFFGLKGKLANPYAEKSNRFRLRYVPGQALGELKFTIGKQKSFRWAYQEDQQYTLNPTETKAVAKKNKKIKFWLPTYQYFVEFPFRIRDAELIYYMEERKYGLNMYDLVFVSWRSPKPQKTLDQYIIWVNRSTGFADKIQYTIRDQSGILKGTAIIDEYRNYNGIFLPRIWKVYLNEKSTRPLHIMRLLNLRTNSFSSKELTEPYIQN